MTVFGIILYVKCAPGAYMNVRGEVVNINLGRYVSPKFLIKESLKLIFWLKTEPQELKI